MPLVYVCQMVASTQMEMGDCSIWVNGSSSGSSSSSSHGYQRVR